MKKKYTFIILLMAMLLIFSVCGASVKASDVTSVSINAPTSATRGETITVAIVVSGSSDGVQGLQGTLSYDSDVLEYVSNEIKADGWFVSGYSTTAGVFLAEVSDVLDTASYITESTSVVAFTFKVNDSAALGSTEVKVSDIVVSGADTLESTTVSESISIVTILDDDDGDDDGNNTSGDTTNTNTSNTNDSSTNTSGTNTSNSGTTNSNTANSSTTNTNTLSSNSSSTNSSSSSSIPYTGSSSIIVKCIFIVACIAIFTWLGKEKYRGIK